MEGQTSCVLCEYRSRSTGSLKQHMESKHSVFNMTIVQVLTQQVERVNDLESQIKTKEQIIKDAEVDLHVAQEALEKEKESLKEKEKAFDHLIISQKQKATEESKLVEELKMTKSLLTKAHEDLETKTNALNAEIEKVRVVEVSTQSNPNIKEVLNVKEEEHETHDAKKLKEIPCKYFHQMKGCRRGNKCWFSHDEYQKTIKKNTKSKETPMKRFKIEPKFEKELKKEQGENLKEVIIELIKLLLRESNI